MNLMKFFTNAGLSVLALAAVTGCGNNGADKKAGDSTTVAPTAGVKPGTAIKYDSSKRYIFLTWDDSPQPPGTVNCKNVFREEGIKATFFSVGFNQVGPQKKRLVDSVRNSYPQFLLANHSFTHGFRDQYAKFYSPAMTDSAYNDFIKNETTLKIPVKIIRLPGNNTWASNGQIDGQKSENALVKKLDANGYKIIGWDLEWHQAAKVKAPKESVNEMLSMINKRFEDEYTYQPNMIVILSHDRLFEKKENADSLRKFISELKKDPRNVFETIDHYPTVQKK
jgi:peptidoglycan/xylan/chitin deacetylase (PgdA/CDA1 family)